MKEFIKNNFDLSSITENFNLSMDTLYNLLDQLTIMQEGAFLHILIFIYILFCIYTIIGILFGNELVKYFNLAEKFPKLEKILLYRARLQNFYLGLNILLIIFVCLGGIALNLFFLLYLY